MTTPVVIIGAGITGLTCAFYLKRAGIPVCIIEQKDRAGGVIQTESKDGFTYELGPNTGVLASAGAAQLFEDLQDVIKIETATNAVKKRYVCKKGKLHPLPMNPFQAAFTPLFTWFDKFNILFEPFRKRGTDPNESLASMVKRRMGQSYLDYAIDPFILGIYAGDPAMLVPRFALPKLYNLEKEYGSFIKGAFQKMRMPKTEQEKKITRKVYSAKGGLSSLIDGLVKSIGKENFIFSVEDLKVSKNENSSFALDFTVKGEDYSITAPQLISTVGGYALPDVMTFTEKEAFTPITNLTYAQVAEVTIGFNKWTGKKLDGFGALIPFKEQRNILGALFMSSLFEDRAPEGGAQLTVFTGGIRRPDIPKKSDEELKVIIAEEFKELLDLNEFNPDLFEVHRYEHAIPQYSVDSQERFDCIAKIEQDNPGLLLAGNIRDGIGMANRIQQGYNIAQDLIK